LNAVDLVESPTGDVLDTVERINDRHFEDCLSRRACCITATSRAVVRVISQIFTRALLSEGSRIVNAGRDNIRTILKRETDYDFSWTNEKSTCG